VRFLYNTRVQEILVRGGQASGVKLADGEVLAADAVVANADLGALDAGLLGPAGAQAVAGSLSGAKRSFSAMTWALTGHSSGAYTPVHHNVFFSNDYEAEFAQLARGEIPADPTVYLCASAPGAYFALINAPANGDDSIVEAFPPCLNRVLTKLRQCGLTLTPRETVTAKPQNFAALFPGSAGALYGRALTGWRDSFARPGAKTKLPGLYLAGGSVHPGPGLPMAALSGRLAAAAVMDFCALSRPVAMPGGILMPSAMTGQMPAR
jgi:1-hydroxycarotenoid 3,4-desaturase